MVASVRAVGTVLVIALLVVPAATGRLLSARLWPIAAIGTVVAVLAGYTGLIVSYEASVNHGGRLASGATVVLALVATYLLAAAVALIGRGWRRCRRPGAKVGEALASGRRGTASHEATRTGGRG